MCLGSGWHADLGRGGREGFAARRRVPWGLEWPGRWRVWRWLPVVRRGAAVLTWLAWGRFPEGWSLAVGLVSRLGGSASLLSQAGARPDSLGRVADGGTLLSQQQCPSSRIFGRDSILGQ